MTQGPAQVPAAALRLQQCRHLGQRDRLHGIELDAALAALPHWQSDGLAIERRFAFTDFHRTMAFVNMLAAMANEQDHHPDLQVSYGACGVRWSTHSAGGITANDLICAARTDALFE